MKLAPRTALLLSAVTAAAAVQAEIIPGGLSQQALETMTDANNLKPGTFVTTNKTKIVTTDTPFGTLGLTQGRYLIEAREKKVINNKTYFIPKTINTVVVDKDGDMGVYGFNTQYSPNAPVMFNWSQANGVSTVLPGWHSHTQLTGDAWRAAQAAGRTDAVYSNAPLNISDFFAGTNVNTRNIRALIFMRAVVGKSFDLREDGYSVRNSQFIFSDNGDVILQQNKAAIFVAHQYPEGPRIDEFLLRDKEFLYTAAQPAKMRGISAGGNNGQEFYPIKPGQFVPVFAKTLAFVYGGGDIDPGPTAKAWRTQIATSFAPNYQPPQQRMALNAGPKVIPTAIAGVNFAFGM